MITPARFYQVLALLLLFDNSSAFNLLCSSINLLGGTVLVVSRQYYFLSSDSSQQRSLSDCPRRGETVYSLSFHAYIGRLSTGELLLFSSYYCTVRSVND